MDAIDRLWQALGRAINTGASEKQINSIVARMERARGKRGPA